MRAMVATGFGPTEVLEPRDMPEPVPGELDLLIEVHASAMNPVDTKIRKGTRIKRPLPIILGFDVSGVVRAVGAKVKTFKVGDAVYASPSITRDGSNAPLVCVDARTAALKPQNLSHVEAAALPLVTLTAWESLHERARLHPSETVLIHAGAGGVGHVAIQLAKLHGSRVITTASRPETIALCRELGADVVIDYAKEDFVARVGEATAGKGCPVVFDTVGGEVFERSLECVAVLGRVVTILPSNSPRLAEFLYSRSATLHYEFMPAPTMHGVRPESQGQMLATACELAEADKLRPHVSHVLALEELREAHRRQETGHVIGKLVMKVR